MAIQLYTGFETPDNATMVIGGITYRCTVFVDVASNSVQARCTAVQDSGAEVEIFKGESRTVYTVTANVGPDSTKIVAHGTVWVVHWLEGELSGETPINPVIRKATLDMSTFNATSTWADQGTLAVTTFQHDLQPVIGDTDYLVAYTAAGPVLRGRRQNGVTWASNVWDAVASVGPPAARAIACYGHDGDNDTVWAYERIAPAANQVWCTRLDADSGLNPASVRSFSALPDCYLWQAGFARVGGRAVALVCEVSDVAETTYDIAILAGVAMSSSTATPTPYEQWVHHVRMLGRPFTFAGARNGVLEPNLYVLAGYQNPGVITEYEFRTAFVLNLDFIAWPLGGADQTIRPRQVSTLNFGDLDARLSGFTLDAVVSGWGINRRLGHVPNASGAPQRGRALKTRAWSPLGFSKLMAMSSSGEPPLQPVGATVQTVRFQVEEPTQIHRDASEPSAPSSCFFGENPFTVGEAREAAAGTIIGGGTPAYYDGREISEVGYAWPPDILDVSDDGVGGNITDGTRQYLVAFERRDNAGQLHRSAPSAIVSHTAAGGAPGTRASITVSTMTISLRDNAYHFPGAPPINIVLYRTEAGGTVFYRVFAQKTAGGGAFDAQDTPENDPSVAYITFLENVSDADLVVQETLPYQLINGAFFPLPPYQPPASSAIAKWQNRIFLASSQDSRLIYFSQEILPEQGGTRSLPPEFSPSLVIRIDGLGRVIAMQEMEAQLLVFTSDAVYSITGYGPDGSGQDSTYQVTALSNGIGCIDQRSVVATSEGVFFQARLGPCFVTLGGAITYVDLGSKVRDTIALGGNLRGGVYLQDRGEVRWVSNTDPDDAPIAIVYDLQRNQWSIHPLQAADDPGGEAGMSSAVACTGWVGADRTLHFVVVLQGRLLIERAPSDATPWADEDQTGAQPVPMLVELQPMHMDGIAGYKRVRRIEIVLEKPSASGVRVTYYAWRSGAYSTADAEVFSFASPAGERLVIGPRHQKVAAWWVRIEELPTVPAAENIRIIGMHAEIGIKRGLRKG